MAKKATKATKIDRDGGKGKEHHAEPSGKPVRQTGKAILASGDKAKTAAAPVENGNEVAARSPSLGKSGNKKVLPVLSTAEIGDHLAATFDMPKSHAKIYLNEAIALIGKHLKRGARVRLTGLGTLQVKKRAARKGRNPNTGEPIKIKASKRVVFAASSDLKAKL